MGEGTAEGVCVSAYVCVCEWMGVGGWGGLVYKMEIYDRDTVASFSLSTLEIIRPSFLLPALMKYITITGKQYLSFHSTFYWK